MQRLLVAAAAPHLPISAFQRGLSVKIYIFEPFLGHFERSDNRTRQSCSVRSAPPSMYSPCMAFLCFWLLVAVQQPSGCVAMKGTPGRQRRKANPFKPTVGGSPYLLTGDGRGKFKAAPWRTEGGRDALTFKQGDLLTEIRNGDIEWFLPEGRQQPIVTFSASGKVESRTPTFPRGRLPNI